MLIKRFTLIMTISLFLLSGLFAQPGMMPQQPKAPHHANMLNLTEEQQNQIREFRLEMQKKVVGLRGDLDKLQSELKLMIIDDKVSEKQLEKQLRKINDVKLKIELARIDNQRKVRSILTDDQKKQFDAMLLSGKKGKKPGMGKKHPMGMGAHRPHPGPGGF